MLNLRPFLLAIILSMFFHAQSAQASVLLDGQNNAYGLGSYLGVLEDKEGNLTIEQILSTEYQRRFVNKHKSAFSLGFDSSVYWFKFSVTNVNARENWILEQKWPNTHHIALYWRDEQSGAIQTLKDGSFSEHAGSTIPHRRPTFDMVIPQGKSIDYYVRLQSDAAKVISFKLWQTDRFIEYYQYDLLVLGGFYGALLLIAFSNFLLYFYFFQISQLWLASFLVAMTLSIAIFEGLHGTFLPPYWNKTIHMTFIPLGCIAMNFLLLFAGRLFSQHMNDRVRRVISCFHLGFFMVAALFLFVSIKIGTQLFFALFAVCLAVLCLYSGRLLLMGNYLLRFFTLGLFCYLIGSYLQISVSVGVFTETLWLAGVSRLCVLLMGVFFTFAFVDVVKWLTREKNRIDKALKETEQKFRAMFQQSFQLSALLSREGRILDVNDPVSELNLMPANEMLGLPLWEVTNAVDNAQTRRRLKREFKRTIRGETRRLEIEVQSAQGEHKWLDISLKPLLKAEGEFDCILAEARDVTQQKKIQQALASLAETASDHSGRNFFENAAMQLCHVVAANYAMIIKNTGGDNVSSVALCRKHKLLTNLTFSLSGTPLQSMRQATQIKVIENAVSRFPTDPVIQSFECNYYLACPILTSQNEVIGYVVLMHDEQPGEFDKMSDVIQVFAARIGSELKSQTATTLLKDTKQRLSAHFKNTPLAVIELDNKLRVQEWNTAAFHMYGFTRDEVLGKKISDLILQKDGYLDDDELQLTFFSNMDGQYSRMANVTKDGLHLVCDWYKTLLYNDSGELIGIAALVADVSLEQRALRELKKQERDQRIILDSLLDSVIAIDPNGQIINVNTMTEKMFGFKDSELLGKNISVLMPEEYAKHHDAYIKSYHDSGEAKIIGIARNLKAKRKDGSLFPIRLTVTELAGSEVAEPGFIGFIHDMTEVQRQEEQIRRSQKMDALGKLTGGIAHDFNNLMGIILGYAEFILFGEKQESEKAKYANEIIKAGERGANLTRKLLSFSKIHQGNLEVLNINEILEGSEDLLRRTITPRIELKMNLSPDLNAVKIDRSDLEDAILNMSINASHAIEGTGTIELETQNCSFNVVSASVFDVPPGDYVLLSISDNGKGMTEETQQNIFDPFYSTKGEMGTGLGLSQVYGFVERSGGAIRVYSVIGKGSSFKLFFPKANENLEH